jgi:hypothetical protein
MEKKQTAVSWLISRLALVDNSPFQAIAFYHDNKDLIEKAKEMEKQQIAKAYANGVVNEISIYNTITGEEYYNETYLK